MDDGGSFDRIHGLVDEFWRYRVGSSRIDFCSSVPKFLILAITGGFSMGSGIEIESRYATTAYSLGDDVSWVKGNHQLSFGGYGSFFVSNSYANVRSSPNFSFTASPPGWDWGIF